MRLTLVILLAAGAVLAIAATPADAAKAINGHCSMHIGRLVRRNQLGSQYYYRTGPKHPGGRHCYGQVRIHIGGNAPNTGGLVWRSYNMTAWNEHNIILVGSGTATVIGCNGVAKGLIAAIETATLAGTDGLAAPTVDGVAAAAGCGSVRGNCSTCSPTGPGRSRT
jgi:hypothetical protein